MGRAVILFSGGLDSTTLVWKMMSDGWEIILLSFNTYRRNPREIQAAELIAARAKPLQYIVQDLNIVREIFDFPEEYKRVIDEKLNTPPNILIPYKNLIYYSLAAHIASQNGAEAIAGGHTLEDQTNLPDASRKYFDRLETLLGSSIPYPSLRILTPLITLSKPEIVRLGAKLGTPLHMSWSCWRLGEIHCGVCGGCLSRMRAFKEAGVVDGTRYMDGYLV